MNHPALLYPPSLSPSLSLAPLTNTLFQATLVSQHNPALLTSIKFLSAPLLTSPSTLLATALFRPPFPPPHHHHQHHHPDGPNPSPSPSPSSCTTSPSALSTILTLSRTRLLENYTIITTWLQSHQVAYVAPTAGPFVLCRLLSTTDSGQGQGQGQQQGQRGREREREKEMVGRLRANGVLVGWGGEYHLRRETEIETETETETGSRGERGDDGDGAGAGGWGWVRLTFAVEEERLREGLRRIDEVLFFSSKVKGEGEGKGEGKGEGVCVNSEYGGGHQKC